MVEPCCRFDEWQIFPCFTVVHKSQIAWHNRIEGTLSRIEGTLKALMVPSARPYSFPVRGLCLRRTPPSAAVGFQRLVLFDLVVFVLFVVS